jgi:hypothetical protein
MTYLPKFESKDGEAKIIYKGKKDGTIKTFDALDFLAQLTTHIPNKNEQMVRYYGDYSNKSRGLLKKERENCEKDQQPGIFEILEPSLSSKELRKNFSKADSENI